MRQFEIGRRLTCVNLCTLISNKSRSTFPHDGGLFLRAYAKEHVGLTRAVFELYRGVFSCFVVMQASALSVGQRLLLLQKQRNNAIKRRFAL